MQVLQNVSAGIRAFFFNGSRAHFDGVDSVTGEKKWKVISQAEDKAYKSWQEYGNRSTVPTGKTGAQQQLGTSLDFYISPTITALLPQSPSACEISDLETASTSLHTSSLLATLSKDFTRALHDLSNIYHDLDLLSGFGALPVSLCQDSFRGPFLRVRFPGCDAETVTNLCNEVGVKRGVVHEDEAWHDGASKEVEMALLFPFAPSSSSPDMTPPGSVASDKAGVDAAHFFDRQRRERIDQEDYGNKDATIPSLMSLRSLSRLSTGYTPAGTSNPAIYPSALPSDLSPTISLSSSALNSEFDLDHHSALDIADAQSTGRRSNDDMTGPAAQDYEGVEGIYRFLRECDGAAAAARRRK